MTTFSGTHRKADTVGKMAFRVVALSAIVGACYLQNYAPVPGLGRVAAPAAFLVAFSLLPYTLGKMRSSVLIFIVSLVSFSLALGLFSLSRTNHLGSMFLSAMQVGYLCFIGYALHVVVTDTSRATLRRFAVLCLLAAIVLGALEIFTPLRGAFDDFRFSYYGEERAYSADMRDLAEHGGFIRPKVFASEPSYFALYAGLLIMLLVLSSQNWRQRCYAFLLFVAIALLVRSPSLLGPAAGFVSFYGIAFFSGPTRSRHGIGRIEILTAAFFGTILIVLTLVMLLAQDSRLTAIFNGTDRSFLQRIGIPLSIALRTLSLSPLFGAGVGGNEAILPLILQEFSRGLSTYYYSFEGLSGNTGTSIITHWTYFGMIGGIVMASVLTLLAKALAGSAVMFWIYFLPTSVAVGGYSFHAWVAFFFIAAAVQASLRLAPPGARGRGSSGASQARGLSQREAGVSP